MGQIVRIARNSIPIHVFRTALSLPLIAVLAATAYAWRPASHRSNVRLSVFDQVCKPGESTPVHARLEHIGILKIPIDLRGEPLIFDSPSFTHQHVKTGDDGIAKTSISIPPDVAPGVYPLTACFPGSKHHKPAEAAGRIFVWPANAPILVVDIDGTISDLGVVRVPFTANAHIRPLPHAPKVLCELAQKYQIVYLTARNEVWYNKTRTWLDGAGFPDGPLFCQHNHLGARAEAFKRRFLQKFKTRFPCLLVGVGNKNSDAHAYLTNDMKTFIIDPTGKIKCPKQAIVVTSWQKLRDRLIQDGSIPSPGFPP